MNRTQPWAAAALLVQLAGSAAFASAASGPLTADAPLSAEAVVARYVEARGGAENWRKASALSLSGTYAAFSEKAPFELVKMRDDLYRLDFTLLGKPAIRARDAQGPWLQHDLLTRGEPARLGGPFAALAAQFEREALFEPVLLGHGEKGISVELLGPDEVDGQPTLVLRLSFAEDREETWHLDPETYLEVAVDQQVMDFTQGGQPMNMRTFFQDFREVEGLVLPFYLDQEFGARLETRILDKVAINPEIAADRFAGPEPAPEAAQEAAQEDTQEDAEEPTEG